MFIFTLKRDADTTFHKVYFFKKIKILKKG